MTSVTINVAELPGRLAEALDLVRAGTEVVVQDAAGPVAKLVPVTPPAKRDWVFNMHPGAMVMREDFDDYIDPEDFLKGNI
jgi:antitoxin (DNA-binding transcriptional repressor) of toxin-antitoxin stability system